MTENQKSQIKKLRQEGLSYAKIGLQLDLPENTVSSFYRRYCASGETKQDKLCPQCGKPIKIIPKRKPKKFCCDRCRVLWWNSHQTLVKRKALYDFVCANCGTTFTAYGNKNRKYCSHACYISARFGREDNRYDQ